MITVYALKSKVKDWIYVGQTNDLNRRINEHITGKNKSTKPYLPFELIFAATFNNRDEARVAERYYKSAAGKRKLKKMAVNGHGPV